MYREPDFLGRVEQAIHRIEHSGDNFLIDQATWLLGFWKDELPVEQWLVECPNMLALLPEMEAEPNRAKRLFMFSKWIDRDDDVGEIANCLRKHYTC